MAVVNNLMCLALVYLSLVIASVYSEDVCVKRTPCMCVFPNGTGIDLTPVAKTSFYQTLAFTQEKKPETNNIEYQLITYYYQPCSDVATNRTNLPGDTCDKPLSLYRVVSLMEQDGNTTSKYSLKTTVCNYLGNTERMQFTSDGKSIIYANLPSRPINQDVQLEKPSQSTVLLTCAQGDNQLHLTSLDDPANVIFTFYSKYACMKQIEEPGRSFGSTLLIVFFSFVIFYLVLGVCTKKFLMGATGIEVIPNLGFWTDLPNLVKDGWAFAIGGFRLPARGAGPAASPDPNSYDSI